MLQKEMTVDVIIPVFNEESCLDELMARLLAVKSRLPAYQISFIFIDDGSSDRSWEMLSGFADKYDFVRLLKFSRNFGHQMAVTAGLDNSVAGYAMIIDADLQDPPELLIEMLELAENGNLDIVYGKRTARDGESLFKKTTAKIFYKLLGSLCNTEIPEDTGDFRLINRQVATALSGMRERHRFIRGMVPWVGFKSQALEYQRDKRYAGETKYPLKKMLRFAADAVFSFSVTPLKAANYLGGLIVVVGLIGMVLMGYLRLFTDYTVPGITAVIFLILIMGGIQIIMIGVIGSYVGRIFEESKGRPLYIIQTEKNMRLQ